MIENVRVLILADDLTGALEAGGKFAGAGFITHVHIGSDLKQSLDENAGQVLVIDTETRHASPAKAGQTIHQLARDAKSMGFGFVYKKTDSTLRGNIGSELACLLSAFPGQSLVYVPAYPKMGRTVRNGYLHVYGIPVSSTHFAEDALNPVAESHIPSLLAENCSLPVVSIKPAGFFEQDRAAVYVCDGESDDEVREAARVFIQSGKLTLAAGPVAFLDHFASMMGSQPTWQPLIPQVSNALIVCGSQHSVSLQQLKYAEQNGFLVLDPALRPARARGCGWFILKWPGEAQAASPLDLARKQAQRVRSILGQASFDALIVFGGDTAHAILQALGNPSIHPVGEVMEGVPVARLRANKGAVSATGNKDLFLVTKAGGFGRVDVLPELRALLASR